MHYKRWNYRGGNPAEKFCDPASDPVSLKIKFDRKWELDSVTGCWKWIGDTDASRGGGPRGWMKANKKKLKSHRMSWILHRGEIPDGQWVLHRCNNSICVNPEHLYLGDHRQNMADMAASGRSWHLKLSKEDVAFIKQSALSIAVLARKFDVALSSIKRVRNGTTHKQWA